MDIRDIRLAHLQQLLVEHDGSKKLLAKTLKKAPAQVSQWFNGVRTITEDSARQIEHNAKLPPGWLDRPLSAVPPAADSGRVTTLYAQPPAARPAWPFPRIDERKVVRLEPGIIRDIETAMFAAAAVLGVSISKRKVA